MNTERSLERNRKSRNRVSYIREVKDDKVGNSNQQREEDEFFKHSVGASGTLLGKKKIDPYLTPYRRMKFRWIRNLNIGYGTKMHQEKPWGTF